MSIINTIFINIRSSLKFGEYSCGFYNKEKQSVPLSDDSQSLYFILYDSHKQDLNLKFKFSIMK